LCTNTFRAGTPHIDRRISNATAIYNYIQKNGSSTEEQPKTKTKNDTESGNVYIVKSGDTLGGIANRNKTTVDAILKKNPGLNPDKLSIGQKIKL
jgi:LysM repeat protein